MVDFETFRDEALRYGNYSAILIYPQITQIFADDNLWSSAKSADIPGHRRLQPEQLRGMQKTRINLNGIAKSLEHSGAVAAWIFGSAKDGVMRHKADLDVAALFGHKPDLDELVVNLARLQEALGVEDIDLTPLDEASFIQNKMRL